MHEYLSTALRDHLTRLSKTSHPGVKRPEASLWTEFPACESKPEMEAAFRQGSVHFTGSLTTTEDRLIFKLQPPVAGMGSALYRRFGSDRFFVRQSAALRLRSDRTECRCPTAHQPRR